MPRFSANHLGQCQYLHWRPFQSCDRTTFEIILFQLPRSRRDKKNSSWHCVGLKVHIKKVGRKGANEESTRICCFFSRESHEFRDYGFTVRMRRLEEQLEQRTIERNVNVGPFTSWQVSGASKNKKNCPQCPV